MDVFEVVHEIGSGSYGVVYSVQMRGRMFALKISNMNDSDALNSGIIREWIFAKSFEPSPNVCPILNKWTDRRQSYFLMPLYDCNLYEFMKKTSITYSDFQTLAALIQTGILGMHRQGWLHRDLKPENVYLDRSGELAIGDFNLVRFKDMLTDVTPDDDLGTTHVCTLWSRAPELVWAELQGKSAIATGSEIDAFSFGILLLSLCRGDYLFGKHIEGSGNTKEVRFLNGLLSVLGVDDKIREHYELGPEQIFTDFADAFINLVQYLPQSWASAERLETARLIAALLDPLPSRRRTIESCTFLKTTFNAEACAIVSRGKTDRKIGHYGPGTFVEERVATSIEQLALIWSMCSTKELPMPIAMHAMVASKRLPIYRGHAMTPIFNMLNMIHRSKSFEETRVEVCERVFLDCLKILPLLWHLAKDIENEPFLCCLLAAWIAARHDFPATRAELESSSHSDKIIKTEGVEHFFKKSNRIMLDSWRRMSQG